MTIEWAPLCIPLNRRLQTLAAAIWILFYVVFAMCPVILMTYLMLFGNIYAKSVCILYIIHIYRTRDLSETGGRGHGISWMKDNILFRYLREYFPIDLVKTADLNPNRNYLFAAYPHGVFCCGVFGNFITDSPKFRKLFPGIRTRAVTLNLNFFTPILREIAFSWGLAAVTKKSIFNLLTASNDPKDENNYDGNTSTAVVIAVGGAEEAIYARPKIYRIVIKKRKGFVKMALITGTPIVPVFSFGEVDILDQPANPSGSLMRKFQDNFKKITGIIPVIFYGRGMFQYTFGFIPKRKPVTTVVGSPIEVVKSSNPTEEEVNDTHEKYMDALKNLFDQHKAKYIPDAPNTELVML